MSRPPLLQSAVRKVRRVPGYRKIRRNVLKRLRNSDTARDIVTRVFSGERVRSGGRTPQRFPSAGDLLDGVGIDTLPVVLISLLDVPEERIMPAVREIARTQLLSAAFRPVFVMDRPRLDTTRAFGYAAELLIEPERWTFEDQSWQEYATNRLGDIIARYQATMSVTISPEGVTDGVRIALGSMAATRKLSRSREGS